jgi:hypothetical protein
MKKLTLRYTVYGIHSFFLYIFRMPLYNVHFMSINKPILILYTIVNVEMNMNNISKIAKLNGGSPSKRLAVISWKS